MNNIPKDKSTKEKNTFKINKLLHIILKAFKLVYEICKVLKSIINLFL